MAKRSKVTKKEFVKQFTQLVGKHLAALAPEERDARLEAAERRLLTIRRGTRPTASHSAETRVSSLSARGRHEER